MKPSTQKDNSNDIKSVLADRIHAMMSKYKGSIEYYNRNRGYEAIAAKLKDEGFDNREVEDAIDEHGNIWWLKR